ncbi:MAG: TspO/MBR family protein [Eubacteriales bacterium]
MKKKKLLFILIPLILGGVSGYLSMILGTHADYVQPSITPPDFVFPMVWTILYILMGIASYRVWRNRSNWNYSNKGMWFYTIQLLFNFAWPIFFFYFGMFQVAFLVLVILFIWVILTFIQFYKIDDVAGLLLIPYILWLIFAGVLNLMVVLLNS